MIKPDETFRALEARGITHVVGLPDRISGPLFDMVVRHPAIRSVTVAREAEAFAIATGLWIGGALPLVVIENTGLLESGDGLRGTAQRASAPIPVLVTARGYGSIREAGRSPNEGETAGVLARSDVDSAALLTEPTLTAWGVPFERCEGDSKPSKALLVTIEEARAKERPVALIVARSLD